MPRIYVQFSGLDQIGIGCKTVASRVDTIETEFWRTIQALDWDVRYEADINNTAKQISRKLEKQTKALKAYQKFINDAYDEYVKLDEYRNSGIGESTFGWLEWFKDITIGKLDGTPSILDLILPTTGLIYITSGMYKGDDPTVLDYSRTPSSDAGAEWLGYEVDGTKVTAWGGKAYAEVQNEVGYAGVNTYLGKVETGMKSDFSFMETETKRKYVNGEWTEETTTEFLKAEIGGGVDVSVLAVDGKAGVGSDMLGAEVSGEGSLGNAEVSGKAEFAISEDGIDLNAKGKAMVTAAEGEVEGTINILGLEITGKLGGYAGGLGVEGSIGLDKNENGDVTFESKLGAAALFGVSVGVEIGFNETGWDNFVDAVTFWD